MKTKLMHLTVNPEEYSLIREALVALTERRVDDLAVPDDATNHELRKRILAVTEDVDFLLEDLDKQAVTAGWDPS